MSKKDDIKNARRKKKTVHKALFGKSKEETPSNNTEEEVVNTTVGDTANRTANTNAEDTANNTLNSTSVNTAVDTVNSTDDKKKRFEEIEKKLRARNKAIQKKKQKFDERTVKVTLYLEPEVKSLLYLDAEAEKVGERSAVSKVLNRILRQYYDLE
jgi:hypothetical protein